MASKYVHDTFVHNTSAAEKIVPFLIKHFNPQSIIDVGCGTGTWMKVMIDNGIIKVKGIEGHHLDLSALKVPSALVHLQDLEKEFDLQEKYDMAVSLEVAEHIAEDAAETFVKNLVTLSDVVLFSAAIPYQGGQNHINEQWLSYWIGLFDKFNYKPHDILRPAFWSERAVEFWYAQNTCIFIRSDKIFPSISSMPTFGNKNVVHPDLYMKLGEYRSRIWKAQVSFSQIGRLFLKKIRNSVNKKFL